VPEGEGGDGGEDGGAGDDDGTDGDDADDGGDTDDGVDKFDLGAMPDAGGEHDPIIPETCEQALDGESTVGCLFFAVDMDSADGSPEENQFAVAVANVQLDQDAEVIIEQRVGGTWEAVAGPQTIDAMDLFTFELPDKHTDDTELLVGGAYRIGSNVPVVAYQFNPVDGSSGYLSDASMLFPVPALDTINHVTGQEATLDDVFQWQRNGYATVVASEDDTEVEVTPSVATLQGMGIPPGDPGVPFSIVLDEGDVASIATAVLGDAMTGTKLVSDKPIAVFSGHECANVPDATCCCDHLEEQIAGVRLWGKTFVASRMPVRNVADPEPTLWQIYASEDQTLVEVHADANVTGVPAAPLLLDRGEVAELSVTGPIGEEGDFHVSADKPIGVFSYMVGSETMPEPLDEIGDPAMVQHSSVEQFLPRYVVLVPGTWENDVAVLTKRIGAVITIDDVPVPDSEFMPVADSNYEVARVPVSDGVHLLNGYNDPFSVIVVGYDQWDSYAYLGGTGTGVINPNPAG